MVDSPGAAPVASAPPRAREVPLWILIAVSAVYAVVFGSLSILRYESFNSSINDLGFYNQLFWVTLHGGPAAWATHSQTNFYADFPWQTSSFLLLEPFYAISPTPVTLLVLQAIGLPLAAVPLYLLARQYGFTSWTALAIGACYLVNFQVQSVNLNDFHLQSFFPLTFFSMILFYESGWRKSFFVAAVISLITNPLTLVLTLGFLVVQLVRLPSPDPFFRRLFRRLGMWIRGLNVEFWVGALGVGLLVFEGWAGLIGAYHLGGASPSSSTGGWSSFVSIRVVYFVAAFAPFLGVALAKRETQILAVPLVVFLALGDIGFSGFIGRQDTLEYSVVALWGLLLFARQHPGTRPLHWLRSRVRQRRWRLPGLERQSPNLTIVAAVVASGALFATLSPVSPWNQVPKLITGVNENPAEFTNVTVADNFIRSAMNLIPPDAPVLTQNNIPQLTGRTDFAWAFPGLPTPNLTSFDYILSDQSTNAFARYWYVYLEPYVESALDSGDWGVLAIGYGVLLLERGYTGIPDLVAPVPFSARDMSLASGHFAGAIAVHPPAQNDIFWYGPYIDLPAGTYTVTFRVMVGSGATYTEPILRLAVTNGTTSSPTIYVAEQLYRFDFPSANTWTDISLTFTLSQFVESVELPGQEPTAATTIYFGGATITPG